MDRMQTKRWMLKRRARRVRRSVQGTSARPRLSVYRSLRHIYAQVVDDSTGCTLVAASTKSPGIEGAYGGNIKAAKQVGALLAKMAKEKSITAVVFDRGGRKYHGRIKALADAAREGGLKF